jgi:energy-converting hydrogenase B subunit D
MIAVEIVVMSLVGALGLAVVLTKDPLPQVIVFSLFGTSLAVLFLILQAPDVALSNIVVGLAYPVMVLFTLAKIRNRQR